jgi:hypothetical protein
VQAKPSRATAVTILSVLDVTPKLGSQMGAAAPSAVRAATRAVKCRVEPWTP